MFYFIDPKVKPNSLQLGFSLIELLVVLALLAIITGLAAPNFTESVKNNLLSSQSSQFNSLIQYSRSQAMMNASTVFVRSKDGSDNWVGKEIISWRDLDGDNTFDNNEILKTYKSKPSISLDVLIGGVKQTEVSFSGLGLLNSAQNLEVSFCDNRTGEKGFTLTVLASGVSAINDKADCS